MRFTCKCFHTLINIIHFSLLLLRVYTQLEKITLQFPTTAPPIENLLQMFTQEEESSRNRHHSSKSLYVLNILHWFNLFQFMRSRLRPVYEATELVAPKPKWIKMDYLIFWIAL